MWFSSWSHNRHSSISGERRRADDFRRRRLAFQPAVRALEDRELLSTLTVTNNLDSGSGSLRAEIAAARSGDTIVFASSLGGQTINLTSGELVINKSLTVQGLGAGQLAISGGGLSRVLEVDYARRENVTVSGLTLENGKVENSVGGAIYNLGTLTVSGCTLTGNGNTAGQTAGGAIDNSGTLTVSGCTITGNTATQGGAIANGGTLTVSNSTLSGNTAGNTAAGLAGSGGAIYNAGNATISNSTLSGNVAETAYNDGIVPSYGGAIYVHAAGSLSLSSSTLSDNSVGQGGYGFAIYMTHPLSKVTVTGCTLTDNNLSDYELIYVDGGTLTVTNSYFHSATHSYILGPYIDGGGNTFN
jgi:hypothetical protein